MPQKAAGHRIEPPVSVPSAIGTIPAAMAAALPPEDSARYPGRVERVSRRSESGIFGCGSHPKLVHISFPDNSGACLFQERDDMGVPSWRYIALQDPGPAGRLDSGRGDIIFYRNRYTREYGSGPDGASRQTLMKALNRSSGLKKGCLPAITSPGELERRFR